MKKQRNIITPKPSFPWFTVVSIVAVLILPLIYGFLYLWAFWDPYGALKLLPVAVVNSDKGGVRNEKPYNLGDRLVEKLKSNTALEWHFVNQTEASDGLKQRKYYAMVVIPPNFSHNVLSAEDETPQAAYLQLTTREASNFMAAKFVDSATVRLVAEINKEVSVEYWHNVFVSLRETGDKLHEAVDGSQKLADGIAEIIDGNDKLSEGTKSAKDGSNTLADGLARLEDGSNTLKNGLYTAKDGTYALHQGLSDLTNGLTVYNANLPQLKTGIDQITVGVSQNKAGVDQALALLSDPGKTEMVKAILMQVSTGLSTVSSGSAVISASVSQAQTGMGQLVAGSSAALAGSGKLQTGIKDLYEGSVTLSDGLRDAHSGSDALNTGLGDLVDGYLKLANGLLDVHDGSKTLHDKLADGEYEIKQKSNQQREDIQVPVLSDPVRYESKPTAKVANNGTGFAPYFIPLALWVGAMACFFIYPSPRFQWPTIRTFGLIGAGQSLLLMTLLIWVLKMEVIHIPLYLAFGIVLSWCYLLIQGVINHALSEGGKFVNILILMLQLTSSAGSYPLETSPKFFQIISPYLPMTYAVKFLREIISGGDITFAWTNLKIIIIMGIGAFIIHAARETKAYFYGKNETD